MSTLPPPTVALVHNNLITVPWYEYIRQLTPISAVSGGSLVTGTMVNGALGYIFDAGSNANTGLQISNSSSGANGATLHLYQNSGSPLAGDIVSAIQSWSNNSSGTAKTYASLYGIILDPTAGSEDGEWLFQCPVAGTQRNLVAIGATGYALQSTPVASSTMMGLFISQTVGGSPGISTNFNQLYIGSDTAAIGTGFGVGYTMEHHFGGSSMTGGREALSVFLFLESATNSSNSNQFYCAGQFTFVANASDGGGAGTERGQCFAFNTYAELTASATHMISVASFEADIDCHTSSSVLHKIGISIVEVATDKVAGSSTDAGIVFVNQTGAVGWTTAIQIGQNIAGTSGPLTTSGTILNLATSQSITNGIDLINATISGVAFRSTNFQVNGSGIVTLGASSIDLQAATMVNGQAGYELVTKTTGNRGFQITNTATGANGPTFQFYHNSSSPAANDVVSAIQSWGKDSNGNDMTYMGLYTIILDATDGSEDSEFLIQPIVAATATNTLTIYAGIQVGTPTGGDKGAGTGNFAGDVYKNNSAYTNPDYAI